MLKIFSILFLSWIIIRFMRFFNKIKITSNKHKNESIKNAKVNSDIQDGEYEDI